MADFNYPLSGLPGGIVFFLPNLFPSCPHMGDVFFGNDDLQCILAIIRLVCAQILFDILGSLYDDFFQYKLQLGYIMPICSGHDEG